MTLNQGLAGGGAHRRWDGGSWETVPRRSAFENDGNNPKGNPALLSLSQSHQVPGSPSFWNNAVRSSQNVPPPVACPATSPPSQVRRGAVCQKSPKMLSRFLFLAARVVGDFGFCPHALGYSPRSSTTRVHQRLAGWATRAQSGGCACRAHAHSGLPAPRRRDASRVVLHREDGVEPLKTGGGGARQARPSRRLGTEGPPAPSGFWVCSFRSFSDAPCPRNRVYTGPRTADAQKEILWHRLFTPCFICHLKNRPGPCAQN